MLRLRSRSAPTRSLPPSLSARGAPVGREGPPGLAGAPEGTPSARREIAAWRRAVVGLLLGAATGAIATAFIDRD